MVFNSRKVFDPATPDENYAVLGQIVADAADICRDFGFVGQADAGNFSQSRVGFLGSHSFDNGDHSPLEGIAGFDETPVLGIERSA